MLIPRDSSSFSISSSYLLRLPPWVRFNQQFRILRGDLIKSLEKIVFRL
ncbi:MAG: hypothetical protein R3E12_06365 [Candidatus Eisenbacteria bacterium]